MKWKSLSIVDRFTNNWNTPTETHMIHRSYRQSLRVELAKKQQNWIDLLKMRGTLGVCSCQNLAVRKTLMDIHYYVQVIHCRDRMMRQTAAWKKQRSAQNVQKLYTYVCL